MKFQQSPLNRLDNILLNPKGLEAKGIYTTEGIIVLEGSQVIRMKHLRMLEYLRNLRAENYKRKLWLIKVNISKYSKK